MQPRIYADDTDQTKALVNRSHHTSTDPTQAQTFHTLMANGIGPNRFGFAAGCEAAAMPSRKGLADLSGSAPFVSNASGRAEPSLTSGGEAESVRANIGSYQREVPTGQARGIVELELRYGRFSHLFPLVLQGFRLCVLA